MEQQHQSLSKEEKRRIKEERRAAKEARTRNAELALIKEQRRAAKAAKVTTNQLTTVADPNGPVDCACVFHGSGYSWTYVEHLYNMLSRNISRGIRFHVYTEHDRSVPPHMIKHILEDWPGVSGPKKSWWYKMQLFNTQHHQGDLLYLDLDNVVVGNLDWITQLSTRYFWAIKEYKHLWRPTFTGINSSIMWWDTTKFGTIWEKFQKQDINLVTRQFHGDQDYISAVIDERHRRFFESNKCLSWRWQALDGGFNFKTRTKREPGTGTRFTPDTSVLVFHGFPKPHQANDPVINSFWN